MSVIVIQDRSGHRLTVVCVAVDVGDRRHSNDCDTERDGVPTNYPSTSWPKPHACCAVAFFPTMEKWREEFRFRPHTA